MRKKVYLAIAVIVIIGFAFYFYFSIYPEQLEDDIYQQNGYAVNEVEEDTLKFRLDKK
ncbi:hypothetical protein GCM10008986_26020 [Salinibacillus aidingensis]|uniref:Uncharacterized protein n=1 Tax=Salinibacillus aidingensis TaxID=237684 RepID=A0ABN1BH78_9BACI